MKTLRLKQGLASLAILSASYIFGGCKNELEHAQLTQIYESNYTQFQNEYQKSLDEAHKLFSEACLDGRLNQDEQRAIVKALSNAKKAKEKFSKNNADLALEQGNNELPWNTQDERYLILLNENLNGVDVRTPEFQKYLKENGVTVQVDGCFSEGEEAIGDAIVSFISAFSEGFSG